MINGVHQPNTLTTAQAIETILRDANPEEMDVAAAYITGSGLRDLLGVITDCLGDDFSRMQLRWITSFDYCRTEPIALEKILSIPNSSVRIHDAQFCISRDCMPRTPFHPKMFLFRSPQFDYVLSGSGNISRSGLTRGFEAGLSVGIDRGVAGVEPSAIQSINSSREWFELLWDGAFQLSSPLLDDYSKIFGSVEARKKPSPTEDDIASDHPTRGSLKTDDLKKLRVCRNYWIDAGNVTRNRGPGLPGNQLMMKRLSRVFFGFEATQVPENSSIGTVELSFGGAPYDTFSLTYSDNKMDKLILPIPGHGGPARYDNQYLLFRNTTPGQFEISVGRTKDKRRWKKSSEEINGLYAMKSGRPWGVF